MRAVVQRVSSARIEVDGKIISEIGQGLLVLVGLLDSDTDVDSEFICRKILNMRLFQNDQTGKPWDRNVMQMNYEVLLVSQFTLYGVLKGNKPDFHVAMPPQLAKPFYETLVERVRKAYRPDAVKDGVFGAMMQVHLVNDGPVTLNLESRKFSEAESRDTHEVLKKIPTETIFQNAQRVSLLKGPEANMVINVHDHIDANVGVRTGYTRRSMYFWTMSRNACHFRCSLLKLLT